MANPGWREESQTIADSWVPAAAEQTPQAEPGPASAPPPPNEEGWERSGWLGRSALASEGGPSLQVCPAAGFSGSPELEEGRETFLLQASSCQ